MQPPEEHVLACLANGAADAALRDLMIRAESAGDEIMGTIGPGESAEQARKLLQRGLDAAIVQLQRDRAALFD